MPKKTARAGSRPAQQRSKEEQWRKRMAAQTRTTSPGAAAGTASAVSDRDGVAGYEAIPEVAAGSVRPTAAARPRPAGGASSARSQAASAALQRRATTPRASARARMGAATLSVDEEMHYIKGDIRRLIILTAICLAVIIALSFVVPSIIT